MDELIKRQDALRVMGGMSTTTRWRREREDPDFPQAVKTGPNSWAYRVADVQRWIASRPQQVRGPR